MYTSKITIVSQFILLVILFLLPTLFLPLNFVSIEPIKVLMVILASVVVSAGLIIQKIKKNSFFVTKNLLWISIIAVLISSLLSAVFSNNINISFFGRQVNLSSFSSIFLLFALSYAVSAVFSDAKSKSKLFLVVHFGVLIVMLMHVLNIMVPFFPSLGFFVNNTINTIGRWYDLGILSLFGMLSSVLVLQYLKGSKISNAIGWIGIGLSTILIVLINSMLIWILAALFALAYIVFDAMTQHKEGAIQNQISYPVLIVLVFSIVFILIGGKAGMIMNSTFNFQFEEVRPSLSSTFEVIGATLKQKPIFGVGINRFETAWLEHRPLGVNNSDFWNTDFKYGYSNILSVPVTHGILGILAWLLFILISVYYAIKLLFVPVEQKSDSFIQFYSVLGYIYFLVVMTLYVPSIVLITLFFVFLGLLISNLNNSGLIQYKEVFLNENPRFSFMYILGLVVMFVIFVYVGFIAVSQYASMQISENASKAYQQTGNLQATESAILKAQFIHGSDIYLRSLTEIGLLNINSIFQNNSLTQEQAIDQFTNILQTTIGYAQAAIAYDQQSYINRITLSSIYKNLIPLKVPGAKEEAIKVIDQIDSLTPNNPSLSLERARIYSIAGEYDVAIAQITRALELKPNFVDAVFLLSQIQVEKGEIDQAIQSIQNAISVQRLNPSLHFQLGLLKYNQKKYKESITSFENAVILSPFFGNAKYFLGLSYYNDGNTPFAITQFEDLKNMYPGNTEVTLVLNNLKSGKTPFDGVQPPLDARPESRSTLPVEGDEPKVGTEDSEQVE